MVVKPSSAATWGGTTFLTLSGAELVSAASRTVSIAVYAPSAGLTVRLKLEQDGDTSKYVEMDKVTTKAGWQTLVFDSAVFATANYDESFVYNKASLFFDFGVQPATDETFYFDNVSYTSSAATTYTPPPVFGAPTVAAAVPTKLSGNVISLFSSGKYTDLAGTDWFPNWGQSSVVADTTAGGVATKRITTLNYEGVGLASPTNVSAMTNLHIDVVSNCTALDIALINSGAVTGGAAVQKAFTVAPSSITAWYGVDIPLTSFSPVNLAKVDQLSFTCNTPAAGSTVYFQNFYFWK